ncbi:MAG: 4Fe-4S dicluster domain-containing protein [Planctomycetota bacterium]
MQYGFVLDHRKCIGCHACTVACKAENDVPVGSFRTWVKYTEIGQFPAVRRHFAVLRCNHCTNAPCVTICPVTALHKRDDGIVDLDRDACIGCKACIQACPYDAIYLNDDTGGAEKCHYCAHRVEQGIEPACVTVCPERAIVPGDLHDKDSEIAQLAQSEGATVRRPEQGTGPNVFYLGADPVSLEPGTAAEPSTYLWSERRAPPPEWPADHDVHPQATTVLDVHHPVLWGWKISFYLVTKGLAAGAALLAPFAAQLGLTGFGRDALPEVLALVFTAITVVFLIGDLKRPMKFFRLITRPNTRSWLVKGGWVLMGFSAVTAAALALRFFGQHGAADALRWPNALLGMMTAGYTAFLFAQCEGRDLWQRTPFVFTHLQVQAVLLGAAALTIAAPSLPLALVATAATLVHLGLVVSELYGRHHTANARQAASLLRTIPAWPGSRRRAVVEGLQFSTASPLLLLGLILLGYPSAVAAALLFGGAAVGVFWYEQALLRAGQLPPLS